MNKLYFVESELCPRVQFDNESDRNELALALWQEHIYFLAARTANWYEDGIVTGIEEDAANNIFTWECQTWFDVPTQVAYFDERVYRSGIAYCDEVICACCGGVTLISDLMRWAPSGVAPIVAYKDWVSFRDEIIGENEDAFYFGEE